MGRIPSFSRVKPDLNIENWFFSNLIGKNRFVKYIYHEKKLFQVSYRLAKIKKVTSDNLVTP